MDKKLIEQLLAEGFYVPDSLSGRRSAEKVDEDFADATRAIGGEVVIVDRFSTLKDFFGLEKLVVAGPNSVRVAAIQMRSEADRLKAMNHPRKEYIADLRNAAEQYMRAYSEWKQAICAPLG